MTVAGSENLDPRLIQPRAYSERPGGYRSKGIPGQLPKACQPGVIARAPDLNVEYEDAPSISHFS
jgi:hypothetical protein